MNQPTGIAQDEKILTPKELAAWIGMEEGTLYQWRRSGRGPRFVKEGGMIRYPLSWVKAWMEEKAVADDRGVVSRW